MKLINSIKREILLKKEFIGIPKFEVSVLTNEKKQQIAAFTSELKKEHTQYIKEISSPEMAMSIELAEFLIEYCISNRPSKIIDLGSGFSSYVFRLYKKKYNNDAIIYSVDDNEDWLVKTKKYLEKHQLNYDNLLTLDELQTKQLNGFFDLVLLDLNFVEKRQHYIVYSNELKNKEGNVIIDDVHKVEFLREVKSKAASQNANLYDIRLKTKDQFGRFAIVLK